MQDNREEFIISTSNGDLSLTFDTNNQPQFVDPELAREYLTRDRCQYSGLYEVYNLDSYCSYCMQFLQIDLSDGHYGAPQYRMFSQNDLANLLLAEGKQSCARYQIFTSNGLLELQFDENNNLQFVDLELAREYLSRESVDEEPWQYSGLYELSGTLANAYSITTRHDNVMFLHLDLSDGHYGMPEFRLFPC